MEKMVEDVIEYYSYVFLRDSAKKKIFIFLIVSSIFLFIHLNTTGDIIFYKLCAFSIGFTTLFYVFSILYDITIYLKTRNHIQFPNNNAILRLSNDEIWSLIKVNKKVHEEVLKKLKNDVTRKLEEERYRNISKLNFEVLFNRYITDYSKAKMMFFISRALEKDNGEIEKYFNDLKIFIYNINLIKKEFVSFTLDNEYRNSVLSRIELLINDFKKIEQKYELKGNC